VKKAKPPERFRDGPMINIREARDEDASAIGKVIVDTWRSTYAGIVPQSFLDAMEYQSMADLWRGRITDPSKLWPGWFIYVVADDNGTVFGFAGGGPTTSPELPYSGELGFIYLLKDHQRRGTGKQLVKIVASRLKQLGHKAMVLWVFNANPSRAFYEALGGKVVGEKYVTRYGGNIPETAYGWDDIDALIAGMG
jgi:GNAT superfamily N-acetyltransferase